MITAKCPSCQAGFRCDDSYLGRTVSCPKCRKPFQMPAMVEIPTAKASSLPSPKPSTPARPSKPIAATEPEPEPAEDDGLSFLAGSSSPASSSGYSSHRSYVPKKKKKTDPTPYIIAGAVVVLVALIGVGLFATGTIHFGSSQESGADAHKSTPEAESTKAKAAARLAKAEAEKAKAEAVANNDQHPMPGQAQKAVDNSQEQIVEVLKRKVEAYKDLVGHSDSKIIDVSFDVQKTNSLVSPYIAILTYKTCHDKNHPENPFCWYENQDTFGWQNGRWVITERLMRLTNSNEPLHDANPSDRHGFGLDILYALEDKAFSN